jgi:hypothetical protein
MRIIIIHLILTETYENQTDFAQLSKRGNIKNEFLFVKMNVIENRAM